MAIRLTSALTHAVAYTAIPCTALPNHVSVGEKVWVGLTLSTVEPWVCSVAANAGGTSIAVTSRVATSDHAINEEVMPNNSMTQVGRGSTPVKTPRGKPL